MRNPFASSAAALLASHSVSDAIWKTYFPELPADKPELRTVLINIHQHALTGEALNVGECQQMIIKHFEVADNTAKLWLVRLEKEFGFVVRTKGTKENESLLLPSLQAKQGLVKVGQEYLVCIRLVFSLLKKSIKETTVDVSDLSWLEDVKDVLKKKMTDYETRPGKKGSKPIKKPRGQKLTQIADPKI